jgi:ethanolamine ammonia-lyase small subunit
MGLEDSVRQIVEQVLRELNGNNALPGGTRAAGNIQPAGFKPAGGIDPSQGDCPLKDLSETDLQKYLQVPEPVNGRLYEEMKLATPARIGVWRCGARPLTDTLLRFRADHAAAQDSVLGEVPPAFAEKFQMTFVNTMCTDKDEYLTRPDLGRKLEPEALGRLRKSCARGAQVQVIVSDGLSSKAVEANIPDLLPALTQGLASMGITTGTPVFVKHGRVAIMDAIGEELKPEVAVVLIGERPGLGTAESMSAYLGYKPRMGMVESERSVISNIHRAGIPASEAGAHLVTVIKKILDAKASGINLEI